MFVFVFSFRSTQLARADEVHQAETVKIMKENVSLIKEINDLRTELATAKQYGQRLEGTLKTTRKVASIQSKGATVVDVAAEMDKSLAATLSATTNASQVDKIIDMQKEEIR